jgi:hemoglobin/transferrin/lactoferrin receptor protein
MKKIYLMGLLLALFSIGLAQVVTIKDFDSGQPLEMATLTSNSPKASAVTNSMGQSDISAMKNSMNIEIRSLGYKTENKSFAELQATSFTIMLKHAGITMDEFVVSASRWSQSTRDIPSKVSTITSRTQLLQNPQTTADLLGNSGKVFIQKSQQGGGSPMIRGFATNRLLYTIDGVRMNTAIFRSGNIQNVISIDPYAIEKAEISFGPGSVIYGSDAIGGVMSFHTLTPQLSLNQQPLITGSASSRYSSANNEKTAHFNVNVGWKKWASVTSFTSSDFDDLRMGSYGPDEYLRPFFVQRQDSVDVVITNEDPLVQKPSGYSQINMMQKLRFKPDEKWNFEYGFHYSVTSEYSRYDRHIRYRKGLPRYGEWSYGPQKWIMNNFSVTHNSKGKAYDHLVIHLAQQSFEESRIDRDINKNERHIRVEKVDAFSLNFDFSKSIGIKHKLFYGLEMVTNEIESIGEDEDISTGEIVPGPSRYPQSSWASYAAYLSHHFSVSKKLIVQTGIRYNQYTLDATFDNTFYPFPYSKAEMNNGALSGSAGMVFKPSETFALNANLSTGFRSPNVDDAGKVFDSEPGSVVVPNPDLKSEFAYNAEIGVLKTFDDFLKIDLTGYYTILQNALVRRDFTLNGEDSIMYDGTMSKVQAIQNAAVASVYGIQAGIDLYLGAGFNFISDFNYQIGEEELDDGSKSPSRHAPPWYGITRLKYLYNKMELQIYSVYSGKKEYNDLPLEEQGKTEIYAIDNDGNPWSPSWYTLNFKGIFQIKDNLSISAGLENITDQRYRPYSSGIVAPGRNLVLSLRAGF